MKQANHFKYRNQVALNPLLKKGGAHQKSKSSQRSNERYKINSYLDEWYEEQQNKRVKGKEESNDSSFLCEFYAKTPTFLLSYKNQHTLPAQYQGLKLLRTIIQKQSRSP